MHDQATTLREMALNESAAKAMNISGRSGSMRRRSIAVTGGKGGVGKSNLAVNVALELGRLGNRVGLLDADFGLANLDLLCGVNPEFHLGHFISEARPLSDITIALAENVDLIPGGSGIEEMANFSPASQPLIFSQMRAMEDHFDIMLIDTAAGIADNVSGVLASASEIIVVVTPEPTSIVDAYATIKLILRRSPEKQISIVVNSTVGLGDAEQVFHSIEGAVRAFLNKRVSFLGMIPHDPQIHEAVREQVPVVQYAPNSPASRAIRLIAKQLNGQRQETAGEPRVQYFWDLLALNGSMQASY